MQNKNFIILILACTIAAMILFRGNCKQVEKPVIIPVKEQVKEVKKNEDAIKPVIDSLEAVVNDLKVNEGKLLKTLSYYQSENKRIGAIVKRPDTTTRVPEDNDYYSQQDAINDLLINNQIADSICNETVENLQRQVNNQGKAITLKDSLYSQLKNSFNTAMVQQDILSDYNKKLRKQARNKRVESFLWKGAALIGGLFILKSAIK